MSQSALKYLKDTEVNISNVLIMTSDFNIRDSIWDLNYPHYSIYRDTLFDITDSFQLELSQPTEYFPTRYSDNDRNSNSVLDLVFLYLMSFEFNSHHIHPNWRLSSDHAPISIDIPIIDKHISTKQCSLITGSNKEKHFLKELTPFIKRLDISFIQSIDILKSTVHNLSINVENIWLKYSKMVNITKHSKVWWNKEC